VAALKEYFMFTTKDNAKPLNAIAYAPFTLSKIERTHSLWRYLWPFQSVKQFLLFMTASIAIALVCFILARAWPDVEPLQSGAGALILALMIIWPCYELPAKMIILTRDSARQFIPQLEKVIINWGFSVSPLDLYVNKDQINFIIKWPPYLAWLYSPEQNIKLRRLSENEIELRGPARILNSIQMFLRWELER
jgi:hypothetical protein